MGGPGPGTVTFLLTDVEGSSRRWERDPLAMRAAIERHDEIVATAVQEHGGSILQDHGEGDSIFAVFGRASDAVAAALEVQLALPPELRVRMALHTGEAGGDFRGPAANRCGRLRALAHGGQVIMSSATEALVRGHVRLKDLGEHRLRDLELPERVYQLLDPRLEADFPPLRSPEARRHNLPSALTSFVGRGPELVQVRELLAKGRLVTLVGAGGSGKTRLALEAASAELPGHPDGVWLVDLAPVNDPDLVPSAMALPLGVRPQPGRALTEVLVEELRDRRLLLLLDNCEHLVDACAQVAGALIEQTSALKVLATSREPLKVAGESVLRVPTLGPDESVKLFLDRARQVAPDFAPEGGELDSVRRICRRLDGIPLALELAAARVRVLALAEIEARLGDRFRLLTGGARTSLTRQQTLRATIDWSYALLTPEAKLLLNRLAVFAGGWSLEAAEAVCSAPPIAEPDVLDLLSELVDKSLAGAEPAAAGGTRYQLLDTLRSYAAERLQESGEGELISSRHAHHFGSFVERLEPALRGAAQVHVLPLLDAELDNLRAALEWSRSAGSDTLFQLAAHAWFYFATRGFYREAARWLDEALAQQTPSPRWRAQALTGRGTVAVFLGDLDRGRPWLESAVEAWRQVGDGRGESMTLNNLALVYFRQDDLERAARTFDEAIAVEQGDGPNLAILYGNRGVIALEQGHVEEAALYFDRQMAIALRVGAPRPLSLAHVNRARLRVAAGDDNTAAGDVVQALQAAGAIDERWELQTALDVAAAVLLGRGEARLALTAMAAAQRWRDQAGVVGEPAWRRRLDEQESRARESLDPAAADAAMREGRALTLRAACDLVLAELDRPAVARSEP